MKDQDKRHVLVEERLRSWLAGDHDGIRRALMTHILSRREVSIQEIYVHLSGSFQVSYHSVSGMVGIISSRIGVLTGTRDPDQRCRIYRIREKDKPVVRRLLSSR